MVQTDPRIDAYIEKAEPFAQPILKQLRSLVHAACPEVQETWKWSFPNFDYKGSILCSMAAHKNHCSFGFWLASKMEDPENLLKMGPESGGMGQLGKLKSLDDLPHDAIMIDYIRHAAELIDKGVKLSRPEGEKKSSAEMEVPDYFLKALNEKPAAASHFAAFSPSKKKDYILWLTEAKTEATRQKRMETALEWIAEGKSKNWKYER